MAEAPTQGTCILMRRPDGTVEDLALERSAELSGLMERREGLVWVSSTAPTEEEIAAFGRHFGLHALALEDLHKRGQRPKLDAYEGQHMVVAYEATSGADVTLSEIQIFVGPTWVLSVHWTQTPALDAARQRFRSAREEWTDSPDELLYVLLDAAVDSYFPALDGISERIDALEDRVVAGEAGRESLTEVLTLKRALLELRRVVAPMRDTANALLRRDVDIIADATMPFYQDLYDHLVRVLDQVDLYRDLLAGVLEARLTVTSNSLNATMKRLTAFTVILMVPTLIAGIYGMNFVHMPELDWPLGYPFAIALMVASVAVAISWFRRRDWF